MNPFIEAVKNSENQKSDTNNPFIGAALQSPSYSIKPNQINVPSNIIRPNQIAPSFNQTVQDAYQPYTGDGYFPATDLSNISSTDVSGRPYQGYTMKIPQTAMNPAVSVRLIDKGRVAAGFDPLKAQRLPRAVLENPRMSEAASMAIKRALHGDSTTELDHIIALGLSGSNNLRNLQIQPGIRGGAAAASDKFENSLIEKVKYGQMSLYDAQNELAKSKGRILPENAMQNTAIQQWAMNHPDVVSSAAELQKTIQDVPKNVLGNLSNIIKDGVSPFINSATGLANAMGAEVGAFTSKSRPLSEKIAATANLVIASANTFFSPLTSVLNALKDVPIVSPIVKIATLPFAILGTFGEIAGKEFVDNLPISEFDKNNLRDAIGNLGALSAQIAAGYGLSRRAADNVVKETAQQTAESIKNDPQATPEKTQEILKNNINKAKQEISPAEPVIKPNIERQRELPEPPNLGDKSVSLKTALVPGADSVSKFITKDIVEPLQKTNIKGIIPKIKYSIERFFDTSIGEPNIREKAAAITARQMQTVQQIKDAAWHTMEERRNWWGKMPEQNRLDFIDNLEKGKIEDYAKQFSKEMGTTLKSIGDEYRKRLDAVYQREKNAGLKIEYIYNYFPHIWEDVQKATVWLEQEEKRLGTDRFSRKRFWNLIEDGRNAGLKLKSSNPEEIVLNREWNADNAISKIDTLERMRRYGLAKTNPRRDWSIYDSPNGKRYWVYPDAAGVLKNAFLDKSLWEADSAGGNIFRGLMASKNMTLAVKLGLSLFHFFHIMTIKPAAETAMALHDWINEKSSLSDSLKRIGKTITLGDQPMEVKLGMDIKRAWNTPIEQLSSDMANKVNLIVRGGGSPSMSEEFLIRAKDAYQKAVADQNWIGAGLRMIPKFFENIQKPLMEWYVPSLKIMTYLRRAETFIRENPHLGQLDTDVALRRMWQETDAQFGQMIYKTLFWNKTIKESSEASLLSLGWQVGFAKTFGEAAIDAGEIAKKIITGSFNKSDISYRLIYAATYTAYAALIGGLMTWAMTGKSPQEIKDYFFPATGGTNPDGSKERLNTVFFTREPFSYLNHWKKEGFLGGTSRLVIDKASPVLTTIGQLSQNKDYYGYQIFNPNDPIINKTKELLKFAEDSLSPISISSYQKAQTSKAKIMSFAGFSTAPRYIAESGIQSKIFSLFDQRFGGGVKLLSAKAPQQAKSEIRRLYQAGKLNEANQKLQEAVKKGYFTTKASMVKFIKDSDIPADVRAFRGLPSEDQTNLLKNMSMDNLERYAWSADKQSRKVLSSLSPTAKEFVIKVSAGQLKKPLWKQGK